MMVQTDGAAAAAHASGATLHDIRRASGVRHVDLSKRGKAERVRLDGMKVILDYAHNAADWRRSAVA